MTRRRIVETGAGGLDRQHERAIRTGAFHRRRLAVRRKPDREARPVLAGIDGRRSEEHTSELQSLMRTSYAVFCLKKKTQLKILTPITINRAKKYSIS